MRRNALQYLLPLALGAAAMVACSDAQQRATMPGTEAKTITVQQEAAAEPGDVIARVGDQTITFGEVNTMLNSSAVVGLSIPALGTPERDTIRIALLDKMVSANLLYLDALNQGLDADPDYQRDMQQFRNAVLADLYYQSYLVGELPVSEAEIQDYFAESFVEGTELDSDLRSVIESVLRKRKREARQAELRGSLRDGSEITVYQNNFSPAGDAGRDDTAPVADLDGAVISWGEVKDRLMAAGKGAVARDLLAMEIDARLTSLQGEIDTRLLAQRARDAGLESDTVYRKRIAEYSKTRLINLHRSRLAAGLEPGQAQLQEFFAARRSEISIPEFRKVQMVMLNTREEAQALKARIEAGELTLYQASAEYSVAPDAKQNLGEIGWIARGKTRAVLDELIFSLPPAEIGGPVEAGELWHLVSVQDVRDEQYGSLEEAATRKYVRRKFIHEKLDDYVVELRKNDFPVQVYEDQLIRLAQQEADLVRTLAARSQAPTSVTRKRIEEMQELYQP